MPLYDHAKNILWIGIIFIVAPVCVTILKGEYSGFFNVQNKVGILCINGPINESSSCIKHLNIFFKDPMIKGIIVHIECKEGAAGSAQLIYQEIEYLKKEYPKPIITLVENICTAEGYLIACATDTIIAPASALVGGIYPSLAHLAHLINPKMSGITSNENYLIENFDQDKATTHTKKIADDIYTELISTIAHRRKLVLKDHELWGKGIFFTGNQALKIHLIDQIGCVADAHNCIKEKALIDGQAQWVYSSKKKYPLEWIKNLIL